MHACGYGIQTKGCGGTDLLDGEPGDGSRAGGSWTSRRRGRFGGGGDLDGNGVERDYDGLTGRESWEERAFASYYECHVAPLMVCLILL